MKILITYALKEESFPLEIAGAETVVVLTGVGKTQAATAVSMAICQHKPDLVLSIGTVGTYRHGVGDILVARRFIDRNMQNLPIPGIAKDLDMQDKSFAYQLPSVVGGQASNALVTINTGDNFVMCADEDLGCDAVDMESFAMAWACYKAGVPFLSIKYVTDILGQNSIAAWADKLACARRDLAAYFQTYGHMLLA